MNDKTYLQVLSNGRRSVFREMTLKEIEDFDKENEPLSVQLKKVNDRVSELSKDVENFRIAHVALTKLKKEAEDCNAELIAALEYHQQETRPIQRTIDILAKVKVL